MYDQTSTIISMIDVLHIIEELSYDVESEKYLYIPIDITTDDGFVNKIIISNSQKDTIYLNNDIIVYNDTAINLNNIVKIKVFTQDITSEKFKSLLVKNLQNIVTFNPSNICSLSRSSNQGEFTSFNNLTNSFNSDYNIQDYITENIEDIKTVNYNGCLNNKNNFNLDISYERVLDSSTNLDVNRKNILKDVNLNTNTLDVVNSIETTNKNILKNIDTEKKLVLTNNANEVEVSKPLITQDIDVLTDLKVEKHNILINQTPTKAINKIIQNQVNSISDITVSKLENTLSNIDIENQIIKTKTIEILDLDPVNKFLDKNILDGKPLMLDPTGERYVGVVLDDGSFEPLKLTFKKFNILDENVNNLVGNIDTKSQLKSVVSDIKKDFTKVLQSLNLEYNNNLLEYNPKNVISLDDAIETTKVSIKNIANDVETTHVVSKENYDIINSVKNVDYDNISHINDIKSTPVINSIEINKDKQYVIDNITLNKNISNVVNNVTESKTDPHCTIRENISGTVDYAGNGIMIVSNDDSNITIYPISKISTIN